jgi:hypothetical protein
MILSPPAPIGCGLLMTAVCLLAAVEDCRVHQNRESREHGHQGEVVVAVAGFRPPSYPAARGVPCLTCKSTGPWLEVEPPLDAPGGQPRA